MSQSKSIAPRASAKRTAIIEAATQEFCSSGFSGTSMDRVAAVAQVSKRTVYNHFPSKDDLFQAILDELITRIGAMKAHHYSADAPLDEQLEAIGRTFAETLTSRDFMKLSRVVVSRFIRSPEWARSGYDQQTRLRQNIVGWIIAGNEAGKLDVPHPEDAAAQFCGMIKEVVYWPELMWGQQPATPDERDTAVRSAVEIFLRHYAVD